MSRQTTFEPTLGSSSPGDDDFSSIAETLGPDSDTRVNDPMHQDLVQAKKKIELDLEERRSELLEMEEFTMIGAVKLIEKTIEDYVVLKKNYTDSIEETFKDYCKDPQPPVLRRFRWVGARNTLIGRTGINTGPLFLARGRLEEQLSSRPLTDPPELYVDYNCYRQLDVLDLFDDTFATADKDWTTKYNSDMNDLASKVLSPKKKKWSFLNRGSGSSKST